VTPDRTVARALAREYNARNDPIGWFEALYARAAHSDAGLEVIPWADLAPNPHLVAWLDAFPPPAPGARALKVGCGLGDDAEELQRRGYDVTAFDVAPTAIDWCLRRYPHSAVRYLCRDLFDAPDEWERAFDLVVEAYTLQVLPPHVRPTAMARMARFVAPQGRLLVICRGREPDDPEGLMPWPLTRAELDAFRAAGLEELSFEDYVDSEDPPARRFRSAYCRPLAPDDGAHAPR